MMNRNIKIGIIDYGLGNTYTLFSAFKSIGYQHVTSVRNSKALLECDKLILPGVGSFHTGIELLEEMNLFQAILQYITDKSKHLLGICLGMQLLFEGSSEGKGRGLSILTGTVTKFEESSIKVPHMGFNNLISTSNKSILLSNNMIDNPDFYFTHSYKIDQYPELNSVSCNYGGPFVALVEKDNVFGVQFHPELSQRNGLLLLSNFIEYC